MQPRASDSLRTVWPIARSRYEKHGAGDERQQQQVVESEKVTGEEIVKLILYLIHDSVPSEDLSDVDPEIPRGITSNWIPLIF